MSFNSKFRELGHQSSRLHDLKLKSVEFTSSDFDDSFQMVEHNLKSYLMEKQYLAKFLIKLDRFILET